MPPKDDAYQVPMFLYERCNDNRAQTDHTECNSDCVKIVPTVTDIRPVQRNRFGCPRIDRPVDWVNPYSPNKHHDQDTGGGEGREDAHHWLLPPNDRHRSGQKERRYLHSADCRSLVAQQNLLDGQERLRRKGLFWVTLKEMRKRNPARKPQEQDAQEFNQSDYHDYSRYACAVLRTPSA